MSGEGILEVNGYIIRTDRFYTKGHEWALIRDDGKVVIGITDYAQKSLHDIVYADLPKVNAVVKQMEPMGAVESVKAVSEIFAPLSGKIAEVNEELTSAPELLNKSPYDDGWIAVIEPSALNQEIGNLITPEEYRDLIVSLVRSGR
jgi:glycine cleavage system H protein